MKWKGTVSHVPNRSIPPRLARENSAQPTSSQWRRRTGHSTRSSHMDPVALPSHRLDDLGPELPAEPADVHVHNVRPAVEIEAPHRRQELLLRHRAARILHQL